MAQLSDVDLRALLPDMNITVPKYATPFSEEQVQPASIDLRLDRIYWRPQRIRLDIDLSSRFRASILSRRPTYRTDAGQRGKFKLKPGEILMARTLEEFTIPKGYSGEIFTRSTFARLGIIVTFGGYINPGYRGHMPLQVANFGHHTVVLPPMISVCQLVLHKLTHEPEHVYGDIDKRSKYDDDDGGPSRWGMDEIIRSTQEALGAANIPDDEQEKILPIILRRDLSTQLRFERFLRSARQVDLDSSVTALDAFSRRERVSKIWYNAYQATIAASVLLIGASIGSIFGLSIGEKGYGPIHFVLWIITGVVTVIAGFAVWNRLTGRQTDFLLPQDLDDIRAAEQSGNDY